MKRPTSRRDGDALIKAGEKVGLANLNAFPPKVLRLLACNPGLIAFLQQLERQLQRKEVTPHELHRLAKAWSAKLPVKSGAKVYVLRHFMQLELNFRQRDSASRKPIRRQSSR
jgi:hypothetical protein